ncbi:MAG: glutaredoxin 3 [Rhizobiaceae bacterium]
MVPVTIYTRNGCPYCTAAVALLKKKGAAFNEYNASVDPAYRTEMMRKSGRSTFPQIFIGESHVGGCDDIHALDARGGLDAMLAGAN